MPILESAVLKIIDFTFCQGFRSHISGPENAARGQCVELVTWSVVTWSVIT